jgi:hypothetical protein
VRYDTQADPLDLIGSALITGFDLIINAGQRPCVTTNGWVYISLPEADNRTM